MIRPLFVHQFYRQTEYDKNDLNVLVAWVRDPASAFAFSDNGFFKQSLMLTHGPLKMFQSFRETTLKVGTMEANSIFMCQPLQGTEMLAHIAILL